jgi:hypothetical protein
MEWPKRPGRPPEWRNTVRSPGRRSSRRRPAVLGLIPAALGCTDGPVVPLDGRYGDAVPREEERRRQPDRATADDQDARHRFLRGLLRMSSAVGGLRCLASQARRSVSSPPSSPYIKAKTYRLQHSAESSATRACRSTSSPLFYMNRHQHRTYSALATPIGQESPVPPTPQ